MIEAFFTLIRSGLYGTPIYPVDLPNNIDWKQILRLAHNQTLEGVLADAVMRLPKEVKVPDRVRTKLMDSAFKITKSHALLDDHVAEVVRFYRNEGIGPILLKGQGIARCYRKPTMRQCGDIDLYIGKENYDRACQLAREKLEKSQESTHESVKHYHFNNGHVAIELHHTAANPTFHRGNEFLKWVNDELSKESKCRWIEIIGEPICLPPASFDVFYIFYHAWRHLTLGGIGLRHLCDWAMVLDKHYEEIDRIVLERILHRYRLFRPWQIFGYIVVNHLGLSKEKMPFYNPSIRKKSQTALNIILEGGNFGFFSSKDVTNGDIKQIDQMPFLQRNRLKLRKYTNRYFQLVRIIPFDATFDIIRRLPQGCINTMRKLLKRKKLIKENEKVN